MITLQRIVICLAVLFLGDALISWGLSRLNGPHIVVYLDKDAKLPVLTPLPETTVVSGERAVLWWSVFHKAMERGYGPYDSRNAATEAVTSVYGNLK